MVTSRLTLEDFFQHVYLKHHFWLKPNTIEQYAVTLRLFDDWHGSAVAVEDLCTDLVLGFLRSRMSKSARTVNNNRAAILTLWRFAFRQQHCKTPVPDSRDIAKLPETKQLVTAWSMQELSRLLDACGSARCLDGWDSRHWRALVLTAYDTSHRLSALLSARREDLSALGFLIIRGEHTKQRRDVVKKLHPDTITAIDDLPEHPLLFPWPLRMRAIWLEYKQILRAAKPPLPCTRRDLFHKLRRTSATHLVATPGGSVELAEQHLDHSTHGLAIKSYIDLTFMPWNTNACDVLPRP